MILGVGTGEIALLLFGTLLVAGGAILLSRVLRSLRHGFSIRLQLFIAMGVTAVLLMGLFGLFVFERLELRAAEVIIEKGPSVTAVAQALIRDFGPQISFVAAVLGAAAAVAAAFLGRGVALPLERLTHAAERIAAGERQAVLPAPVGREVRRLTNAFESMRRSLEDRHAIEQFVADLSHELKNPVSAIRAASEVLAEGAAEEPEARTRFLHRIDEASRRLEVLLDDLLALARIEARGIEADDLPVSVDEIVRASVAGCAARLEARRQRVDLVADAVRVRGSARWLRRAVDNLLTNAIRYSPERSAIEVRVRAEDDRVVVEVRDVGPGVAPAMRERVFERFITDRADSGGTGLGLAIVRTVAEHHGGGVELVECGGGGACFEMWLRIGRGLTSGPV